MLSKAVIKMPYKCENSKLKIKPENDRRVKLTAEQKAEIKKLYGKVSQRKLAKAYGVSRRLIIFIGCPEKKVRDLQLRQERGGTAIYYDKEKHLKSMKKYRHHKQELYLSNKLEGGKNNGNKRSND
jgi:hypothetical protein